MKRRHSQVPTTSAFTAVTCDHLLLMRKGKGQMRKSCSWNLQQQHKTGCAGFLHLPSRFHALQVTLRNSMDGWRMLRFAFLLGAKTPNPRKDGSSTRVIYWKEHCSGCPNSGGQSSQEKNLPPCCTFRSLVRDWRQEVRDHYSCL